jgi:hypothetical protein
VVAVSLEEALHGAIRERAVRGDSVEALARRAGFSTRQLRRLAPVCEEAAAGNHAARDARGVERGIQEHPAV